MVALSLAHHEEGFTAAATIAAMEKVSISWREDDRVALVCLRAWASFQALWGRGSRINDGRVCTAEIYCRRIAKASP
jgi:hypothetical protein